MKQKSLYNEIIFEMEAYLERIDSGEDGHFKQGVLGSNKLAARYAIANMIGHIKAIKGLRDFATKDKLKKKHKRK